MGFVFSRPGPARALGGAHGLLADDFALLPVAGAPLGGVLLGFERGVVDQLVFHGAGHHHDLVLAARPGLTSGPRGSCAENRPAGAACPSRVRRWTGLAVAAGGSFLQHIRSGNRRGWAGPAGPGWSIPAVGISPGSPPGSWLLFGLRPRALISYCCNSFSWH